MRVGGYYHYILINSMEEHDASRISTPYTPLQRGSFGCCAEPDTFVSNIFIALLIRFVCTSLVSENTNNGLSQKIHAGG